MNKLGWELLPSPDKEENRSAVRSAEEQNLMWYVSSTRLTQGRLLFPDEFCYLHYHPAENVVETELSLAGLCALPLPTSILSSFFHLKQKFQSPEICKENSHS